MQLQVHCADDFSGVLQTLLPPGEAWNWPTGGLGVTMLGATAVELTRVDAAVQDALDLAIERHRIARSAWQLTDYQRVADQSQSGVIEMLPRSVFGAGSFAGERLWQSPATFSVPLTRLSHARPFGAGSFAGERIWGLRARYVLVVRYYKSVADLKRLWDALIAFKQAHFYLWFIDITENGGEFYYGQN